MIGCNVLIVTIFKGGHVVCADRVVLLLLFCGLLFCLSRFCLELTLFLAVEPTTLLTTDSSIFVLQSLKSLLDSSVGLIYRYLVDIVGAL